MRSAATRSQEILAFCFKLARNSWGLPKKALQHGRLHTDTRRGTRNGRSGWEEERIGGKERRTRERRLAMLQILFATVLVFDIFWWLRR